MRSATPGPVEVRHDGVRRAPAAGRERSLPALLVLNTGRVLTRDHTVDPFRGDPPDGARAQVYNPVSRLRRTDPGEDAPVTGDGGHLPGPGPDAPAGRGRWDTDRGGGAGGGWQLSPVS